MKPVFIISIIILSCACSTFLFMKRVSKETDDIDRISTAKAKLPPTLKSAGTIYYYCDSANGELIQNVRFAFAPSHVVFTASADTLLHILLKGDTSANAVNVIWNYTDDKYDYKLSTR